MGGGGAVRGEESEGGPRYQTQTKTLSGRMGSETRGGEGTRNKQGEIV